MTQYICETCGVVVRAGAETLPQHCNEFMVGTEIPQAVCEFELRPWHHQMVYHEIRKWELDDSKELPNGMDIVHETELSPGTVYPAIDALEELGVIESRPALNGNSNELLWATDTESFDDHGPEEYKQLA